MVTRHILTNICNFGCEVAGKQDVSTFLQDSNMRRKLHCCAAQSAFSTSRRASWVHTDGISTWAMQVPTYKLRNCGSCH